MALRVQFRLPMQHFAKTKKLTIINNELTNYLYMSVASTAIDEKGIAKDLSLRKIETTIPCNVYGTILNVADEDVELLLEIFKWVKRLGLGRNRRIWKM